MISLSVVFATLNRVQYLRPCLDSIYRSVRDLDFEVIVIDGGSTDGSLELLRTERSQSNIVLVEQGRALGCIKAFNAGFEIAHGLFVANINDDCIITGDTLANAVRFIENREDVGQVAIPYGLPDAKPEVSMMKLGGRIVPYANFGVTPKCLGDKVGWWGGDEINLFRYAGDNQLSAWCWALGCKVEPLPIELGHIIHYEADDATRINSPNDTTKFYSYWNNFKWD